MAYKFTRLFVDTAIISSNGYALRRLVEYPTTEGLEYELNSTGYYICNGRGTSVDSAIVIAYAVDGVAVTTIKDVAFYHDIRMTSLVIPDSVTTLGTQVFEGCENLSKVVFEGHSAITIIPQAAFRECSNLEYIDIPNTVTQIDSSAFYLCSNLAKINIPNSVKLFGASAFSGCSKLTSVNIPNGVTELPNYMLSECSSLTNIDVPDTVKTVGNYVFHKCTGVTSLTLPTCVTNIGRGAFAGCTNLASLTMPCVSTGASPSLGNFFSYPNGSSTTGTYNARYVPQSLKTVVITEGSMTYIDNVTFQDCQYIESITLPDTVTQLGTQAFKGCTNLSSLVIGSGVRTILSDAFRGCANLSSITFTGTVAQWNEIQTVGQVWDPVPAEYAVCSDGTVTLEKSV